MADRISKEQRSRNMAHVKNKNTAPELLVRRLLHSMGYRFRLHRRDLPGSPDIVLPRPRKVIFVHGCFWHGHTCSKGRRPSTRQEFWNAKLDKNLERDSLNQTKLMQQGWQVLVVWDCETKNKNLLTEKLLTFLQAAPSHHMD